MTTTMWIKYIGHPQARIARMIALGLVCGEPFFPGQKKGLHCDLSDTDRATLDIQVENDYLVTLLVTLDQRADVVEWGFFDLGQRHLTTPSEAVEAILRRSA